MQKRHSFVKAMDQRVGPEVVPRLTMHYELQSSLISAPLFD